MAIRIIDNHKIELTEKEWEAYQELCRAYDRPNFSGKELFRGLFDSDDRGIITYIHPPSKHYTSMEVWCWIVAIFHHQHVRLMHEQVNRVCEEVRENAKKDLDK